MIRITERTQFKVTANFDGTPDPSPNVSHRGVKLMTFRKIQDSGSVISAEVETDDGSGITSIRGCEHCGFEARRSDGSTLPVEITPVH